MDGGGASGSSFDGGINTTDYANRSTPIYSINPDFITQW